MRQHRRGGGRLRELPSRRRDREGRTDGRAAAGFRRRVARRGQPAEADRHVRVRAHADDDRLRPVLVRGRLRRHDLSGPHRSQGGAGLDLQDVGPDPQRALCPGRVRAGLYRDTHGLRRGPPARVGRQHGREGRCGAGDGRVPVEGQRPCDVQQVADRRPAALRLREGAPGVVDRPVELLPGDHHSVQGLEGRHGAGGRGAVSGHQRPRLRQRGREHLPSPGHRGEPQRIGWVVGFDRHGELRNGPPGPVVSACRNQLLPECPVGLCQREVLQHGGLCRHVGDRGGAGLQGDHRALVPGHQRRRDLPGPGEPAAGLHLRPKPLGLQFRRQRRHLLHAEHQ